MVSYGWRRVSGRRPMISGGSLEPACQSGPDVAAYPILLPPTLGEHVEQNVSLATSSDARLRRPVRVTVLLERMMSVPWNWVRHHGSTPPRKQCTPGASWGSGGLSRHPANSGPDFRSSSSFRARNMNRHRISFRARMGEPTPDFKNDEPTPDSPDTGFPPGVGLAVLDQSLCAVLKPSLRI